MELSGSYFTYNGTSSREYGLIFANANTNRMLALAGDVNSVTIYNKSGKRNYHIGESYEDSHLVFEAELVTDDDHVIGVSSRREIEKWLFHQADYRKLYIDIACDPFGETYEMIDGELKQLYLNCRFINPEKLESGSGIIGYKFTVECDSRMAWQDPVIYSYEFETILDDDISNDVYGSTTFNDVVTVNVNTDTNDYVYPKVVITMGSSGGDIIIINLSDDETRTTKFTGLTPNITFTMKGEGINYVSGDNYLKYSNRNFIRLLDGENKISLYGDIAGIEFEFQNQRYL